MKISTKKLLSILLSLVLLLGLAGPTMLTVRAAEPDVELSLTLPSAGGSYSEAVPAEVSISSGTGFKVEAAYWYNEYGIAPTTFETGKAYFASIYLKADEGYELTASTEVKIDSLGVKDKTVMTDGDYTGCLCVTTDNYVVPATPEVYPVWVGGRS